MEENDLFSKVEIGIECDPVSRNRIKQFAERWGYDISEKEEEIIIIIIIKDLEKTVIDLLKDIGIDKEKGSKYLIIVDEKKFNGFFKYLGI